MASPFHVFRKHQKVLLVSTGLMAMIAFVFVAPWNRAQPKGGHNNEVVTSRYGTVYEADMQRMVQTRHVLKEFLERAYQQGLMRQGQPEAEPLIPYDATPNEQSTINTMLAARKAEDLGFIVNNDVINTYLRKLTAGKLSSDDIRDILAGYHIQDRSVGIETIFSAIRDEMLANKLRETYDVTLTVTPGQRWQHYLQLRDRVKVELLPIPVSQFVHDVPEPTEAQIKDFYEKYKDQVETPDLEHHVRMESPEPGFKLPPRSQFRYLVADYDAFVELAQSEVTTEQIQKYYDDNKDRQFKRATLLDDQEPKGDKQAPTKDEPATDEPKPEEGSKPDDPKSEESKPEEPKADEPKKDGEQPADKAEEKGAQDKLNANFDLLRDTQFINADDAAPAGETPAKEEAAKEEPAKSEPAEEKPAAETPADEKPKSEDPAAELKDDDTKASEPKEEKPAAKPVVRYIPLAEVEDDIRRTLAREKAAAKIDAVLEPITVKLQSYSIALTRKRDKDPSKADSLVAPDMEAIAKTNNLELRETKLISYFELSEDPLGQTRVVSEATPYARADMFANYAFTNLPRLFAPVTTQDDDGNRYLIWKIAQAEEAVPPLADIRQQVIDAWKVIKARDLALAEAEKLAKTAQEHKDSLSEVFSDKKDLQFINTEPFSWFTMGAVPGDFTRNRIRLSEIDGVNGADMAFMKKIFALKDGEVTVAMNHGKNVAYVIRMIGHEDPTSELRKKFLGQPGPWLQMAQQQNYQQVIDALNNEIEVESKLSKKRDLDQRERDRG